MANHKDPLDNDILSLDETKVRQLTGSCLCGDVSYKIDGPVRDVVNCFCEQCRKTSGHYVAASSINKDHLTYLKDKTLEWYECLPKVYRGFCKTCGSSLFWDNANATDNKIAIMAGTLDGPTKLKTIGSIYTKDASDYCDIPFVEDDS